MYNSAIRRGLKITRRYDDVAEMFFGCFAFVGYILLKNNDILQSISHVNLGFGSAIAKVRYRKCPGWTGLDTNNLFLLNCRRERQTNPNPNPNPNPNQP